MDSLVSVVAESATYLGIYSHSFPGFADFACITLSNLEAHMQADVTGKGEDPPILGGPNCVLRYSSNYRHEWTQMWTRGIQDHII